MSPYLLAFGLLGPLLLGGNAWSDRRAHRHRHEAAMARHTAGLEAASAELEAGTEIERAWLEWSHPDPAAILSAAEQPADRLWSRRPGDPDFLSVRLGCGAISARSTVQLGATLQRQPILERAPVTLSLNRIRLLALHGHDSAGVARSIVGQIAVLHSPSRVRLLLVGPAPGAHWSWWGLLPHARLVDTPDALDAVLAGEPSAGWSVALALTPSAWPAEWRRDALFTAAADPARQLSVIALEDVTGTPPLESHAVLTRRCAESDSLTGGPVSTLVSDSVGDWWAHRVATALAPLCDSAAPVAQVPERVTLGDLVNDPDSLVAQWNSERPIQVLLGVDSSGPVTLDLDRDGPHVLIAGTTGSGKSELLRTIVAGLALAHSPTEVSLLLVDYKGGAAFGDLADLPHVAGMLTDLDEHEAERALLSLQAELRRREHLLKDVGASSAIEYAAMPDTAPLARLVVVIDEFRVLADELPEFLDGMVRIAATGRSLGVHLLLATQRPAGVVSADIKANVNCRIALRVRDRADSQDVIESDDAARLPSSVPGRALLRSGSGPLTELQTALVGGAASEHAGIPRVRMRTVQWPTPPQVDGSADRPGWPASADALVDYLCDAAASRDIHTPQRPWLPPLPEILQWPDILAHAVGPETPPPEARSTGELRLGLADIPDQQRRELLSWNPTQTPRLAIIGTSRSGRTNALRVIARATTLPRSASRRTGPAEPGASGEVRTPPSTRLDEERPLYRLHCITDGAGGFSDLATWSNVNSMVPRGDLTTLRRFATRMLQDIAARKVAMQTRGFASLATWRAHAPEEAPPFELVLVDGWDQLAAASEREDHGETADLLATMLREGESTGVALAATGDRSLLLGRPSGLFGERLLLRLSDPADAALAGLRPSLLPQRQGPGRVLRGADGREAQLVWCPTDNRASRHGRLGASPTGPAPEQSQPTPWPPVLVRPVPQRVTRADLLQAPYVRSRSANGFIPVGLGGDGRDALGLDLTGRDRLVLVSGPRGSGRTTTLAAIAEGAAAAGRQVVQVAIRGSVPLLPDAIACVTHEEIASALHESSDPVVLVDDADRLTTPDLVAAVSELARLADEGRLALVCSADPARVAGQFRGPVFDVARAGCGILLNPTQRDGELLGVRLPRGTAVVGPGRGLLVRGGDAEPLQVVEPAPGRL
ncbi:FtsK/SpoIIIE domain-containing protein [Actinomycetota bacterium]